MSEEEFEKFLSSLSRDGWKRLLDRTSTISPDFLALISRLLE